jgi:hypothetical protein
MGITGTDVAKKRNTDNDPGEMISFQQLSLPL